MKILVTCFDPFGGEPVNPASLVVDKLPDNIDGAQIIKLEIPTVFGKSADTIFKAIEQNKPDVVLSIGQAGNRTRISIERVGINIDDARIPDNENNSPIDELIDKDGPTAYFTTLPFKSMAKYLIQNKIPVEVSNTAGTYVCNHVMYSVLNYINKNKLNILAGFIHIPYVPMQVIDKPNTASMPVDALVEGITLAIKAIINPAISNEDITVDTKTN